MRQFLPGREKFFRDEPRKGLKLRQAWGNPATETEMTGPDFHLSRTELQLKPTSSASEHYKIFFPIKYWDSQVLIWEPEDEVVVEVI